MRYFEEKHECMTRAEMKALQSERLCKTVKKVYEAVPYYRVKMDAAKLRPSDIKSVDDLYKLPFTTKADLRDNYPFGLFAAPREDITRIHASSGTTGKMTVVGYTARDLEIWNNTMARAFVMAGAKKGSMVHIAYGYGLFTGGLGAHGGAEYLGATAVPAGTGNTARQITLIMDLGAEFLCCTPSYAVYLAEEMQKAGIRPGDTKLKAGIFGAEPWSEGLRREIEEKLSIRAYDIYGLSEIIGPSVSMECHEQNGLHIQEDHFLPEIIDPDTLEQLPEGREGEIVFSTITKEGMPLIRYRTRDLCSLTTAPCKCGRTTARMSRLKGRSDDMLIIKGINVFPSQIETVLFKNKEIFPHYQIVVDSVNWQDRLTVNIETPAVAETAEREKIKARTEKELANILGIKANVVINETGTIPRSEGKAVRIKDNRKLF